MLEGPRDIVFDEAASACGYAEPDKYSKDMRLVILIVLPLVDG